MTTPDKTPRPRPLRRKGAARVIKEATGAPRAARDTDLVRRPDGWYWLAPGGHQEFGPFETAQLAHADREGNSDDAPAEGETIGEAEAEIGIADWIDAETGEPAEGQSRPHLGDS
jgi:hypothetical protein